MIIYSPTSKAFYFSDDANAPVDSFPISDADHVTARELPPGATFSFSAPVPPATTGTLTASAPTSAYQLSQAQGIQIGALQKAYAAAINAPVSFKNAAGVTSTYPAGNSVSINGQTATQNLANVISSGAAAWTLGKWLDTSNVAQTFTFSDLQGLAAAMEAVEILDWTDLVVKVAAVQAALTVEAVQEIIF